MSLTVGSAFSGAGGFDLGFHRAGFRVLWQCESDPTCRSVLARHWPGVPCHPDIRGLKGKALAKVDVLIGGFPCQDLSVAGNRAGLKGERSGLFYEFARIVREVRPRLLVWENVPGLLSSDSGRDFARVLRELADGGYHGAWRVLDAQHFGVPQVRRRVFGVFARGRPGTEYGPEVLALADGLCRHPAAGRAAGADVARTLGSGPAGSGFRTDLDHSGAFVPSLAGCLTSDPRFGGPDDNDARAGRVIAAPLAACQTGREGKGPNSTLTNGNVVAGQCHGSNVGDVGTLRKGNGNVTGGVPFVVRTNQTGANGSNVKEGVAGTNGSGDQPPCVAFNWNATHLNPSPDSCPTIRAQGGCGSGQPAALDGAVVRRLTPRECERLQGWPDDHTRYRDDGTEIKDGPRYRMIGNGVAEPVAEWIARRAARVLT